MTHTQNRSRLTASLFFLFLPHLSHSISLSLIYMHTHRSIDVQVCTYRPRFNARCVTVQPTITDLMYKWDDMHIVYHECDLLRTLGKMSLKVLLLAELSPLTWHIMNLYHSLHLHLSPILSRPLPPFNALDNVVLAALDRSHPGWAAARVNTGGCYEGKVRCFFHFTDTLLLSHLLWALIISFSTFLCSMSCMLRPIVLAFTCACLCVLSVCVCICVLGTMQPMLLIDLICILCA